MAEPGFQNRTPYRAAPFLLLDERAAHTLTLIVKATFDLGPVGVRRSAEQAPIVTAPVHRGLPGASSLVRDSDLCVGKPGTDVVLVGHAEAERPGATECLVSLAIGPIFKQVRVLGDRVWARAGGRLAPSAPAPFESIPLVWERAFGGPGFEQNPVGVGLASPGQADHLDGAPLPNLEDPRAPITEAGACPPPACFGWVCPGWMPRRARAGTFDAAWERSRFPHLPLDFQRLYHSGAPDDQRAERPLAGGESLEVQGISRGGPIRETLPRVALDGRYRMRGEEPRRLDFTLDTVLIDGDGPRLELTYRASVTMHRRGPDLAWCEVGPGEGGDRGL
ncbi:MAG: DUF2169 domain-containing protein [Byssovorax sp.]